MAYKVVVPKPISEAVRKFHLSRPVVVQLFTALHSELPLEAGKFRKLRVENDEGCFQYRKVIVENDRRHLFFLAVDETTAPDHLIIRDVQHQVSQ